ncbi:AB hydrolase-1 domain-containing protein [Mycena indigotica]|uniref:AB hydrolase-1 domain-containing protein n=1 Tax=Mycena indigotica TaxID=2126181 RepID=A0A8H6VSZ2_9AGAR|nr:AB hydrolase-1 domain-containing protein [Mycena indigotica]KAF7290836.1 AB hydrolase-1 domain-containing protein [Mycena indigotica]
MQQVSINSIGGPLAVAYTIATPTSPSAKAINPSLPTVLLLHPLYLGQICLHYQFADARLRQFNLVAVDLRNFGDSVGPVKPSYDVGEAVDDVVKFMEALALPAVHIVGINLGAMVAIELAALWPQRVASLTAISPPAMEEVGLNSLSPPTPNSSQPAEVAEGRREILEYWAAAFGSECQAEPVDESALLDAVTGALQLGLNGVEDPLIAPVINIALGMVKRHQTAANLDAYERTTVSFFTERSPPTLRGIACPVLLVHCGQDIAYDRAGTEALREAMLQAGVESVRLEDVPEAPQWGHITHPKEVNQLIYDHVIECAAEQNIPTALKSSPVSPFSAALNAAGFLKSLGDESDSEDDDSD